MGREGDPSPSSPPHPRKGLPEACQQAETRYSSRWSVAMETRLLPAPSLVTAVLPAPPGQSGGSVEPPPCRFRALRGYSGQCRPGPAWPAFGKPLERLGAAAVATAPRTPPVQGKSEGCEDRVTPQSASTQGSDASDARQGPTSTVCEKLEMSQSGGRQGQTKQCPQEGPRE